MGYLDTMATTFLAFENHHQYVPKFGSLEGNLAAGAILSWITEPCALDRAPRF